MTKKQIQIEMSRAFRSLGLFRPDDVKVGFEAGKFCNGDFARYEDSGEWRPIEVVVGELKQCKSEACTPVTEPEQKAKKKEDQIAITAFNSCGDSFENGGACCGPSTRGLHGIIGFIKEVWARF